MQKNRKIGFIGQGWIGKNYADNFESRGFDVVRYSLESEYVSNKDKIGQCDVVFVAVPTPTRLKKFDDGIVRGVLSEVSPGSTVVIKSTLLPGSTKQIQRDFPHLIVLINPEFLSVQTAKYDADFPTRNIIGMPVSDDLHKQKASLVMKILPKAPFELICDSTEAELIKYARNCIGYARVLMANVFYDLSVELGVDYENLKLAISADPDNGPTYANAIHKSGRGAGGECFIKDFAALTEFYRNNANRPLGIAMLQSMESMNIDLLRSSHKDIDLLNGVYGE